MGPKSQSHPTDHSLPLFFSFLLHFSFFLSSSLSVLLQSKKLILTNHSHAQHSFCFLLIQCCFFLVLLPPITHTPTHADPSREIIGINLHSHVEKLHHAFVLLLVAIVLVLQSGRASKSASIAMIFSASTTTIWPECRIGIHNNDSNWKLCCRRREQLCWKPIFDLEAFFFFFFG